MCSDESGVHLYSENGTALLQTIIARSEDCFCWQIIKLNGNTFWSIKKTQWGETRLRSSQTSQGLSDIHWQDIDISQMSPDCEPLCLAYDNIATVFVLDGKHGNIHSFLNGVYLSLIVPAESAGLIKPTQIEFDRDNHLLYILQKNGDIKVVSIKYD